MIKLGLLLLLWLSGCSGAKLAPFDERIPVKGRVSRGGAPVSGGVIRLDATAGANDFMINGVVGPDGSFTLTTVRTNDSMGERNPGVPAGVYQVIYTPPREERTQTSFADPDVLPDPVTIAEGQRDLKIELPARS